MGQGRAGVKEWHAASSCAALACPPPPAQQLRAPTCALPDLAVGLAQAGDGRLQAALVRRRACQLAGVARQGAQHAHRGALGGPPPLHAALLLLSGQRLTHAPYLDGG